MAADNETPWLPDGDISGCNIQCDKCKQLRLREGALPGGWCRRCKYTHYDEYFGKGGVNEMLLSCPSRLTEPHPAHGYNDDAGSCPGIPAPCGAVEIHAEHTFRLNGRIGLDFCPGIPAPCGSAEVHDKHLVYTNKYRGPYITQPYFECSENIGDKNND